jgi:hypothetical protein
MMTREEYERRRQRLDGELRAGIEALETAHRLQVRALDLTWMMISQESTGPAGPSDAAPSPTRPPAAASTVRPARDLLGDLEDALADLPDVFDRNDICRRLGYVPERSTLYRALQELVQDGSLTVQKRGEGRVPTRYAKRGAPH